MFWKKTIISSYWKKQKWVNKKNTEIHKFSCVVVTKSTNLMLPTFGAHSRMAPAHPTLSWPWPCDLLWPMVCLWQWGVLPGRASRGTTRLAKVPFPFSMIMNPCLKLHASFCNNTNPQHPHQTMPTTGGTRDKDRSYRYANISSVLRETLSLLELPILQG